MSDDRWRDTYDAWKTRDPDADARGCDRCGGELTRCAFGFPGWYCESCEPWPEKDEEGGP